MGMDPLIEKARVLDYFYIPPPVTPTVTQKGHLWALWALAERGSHPICRWDPWIRPF